MSLPRKALLPVLIVALALLVAAVPSPSAAGVPVASDLAGAAARHVRELAERSLAVLYDESLSAAQRDELFRGLFLEGFDTRRSARYVLSQGWRKADERQREEFVVLFREELLQLGKSLYSHYKDGTMEIERVRLWAGDEFLVETRVSGAKTGITDIDFVVSMVEGEPRIVDVRFQGLSVLETYRAEFIQQVFRGGVEGVLRGLRPHGSR